MRNAAFRSAAALLAVLLLAAVSLVAAEYDDAHCSPHLYVTPDLAGSFKHQLDVEPDSTWTTELRILQCCSSAERCNERAVMGQCEMDYLFVKGSDVRDATKNFAAVAHNKKDGLTRVTDTENVTHTLYFGQHFSDMSVVYELHQAQPRVVGVHHAVVQMCWKYTPAGSCILPFSSMLILIVLLSCCAACGHVAWVAYQSNLADTYKSKIGLGGGGALPMGDEDEEDTQDPATLAEHQRQDRLRMMTQKKYRMPWVCRPRLPLSCSTNMFPLMTQPAFDFMHYTLFTNPWASLVLQRPDYPIGRVTQLVLNVTMMVIRFLVLVLWNMMLNATSVPIAKSQADTDWNVFGRFLLMLLFTYLMEVVMAFLLEQVLSWKAQQGDILNKCLPKRFGGGQRKASYGDGDLPYEVAPKRSPAMIALSVLRGAINNLHLVVLALLCFAAFVCAMVLAFAWMNCEIFTLILIAFFTVELMRSLVPSLCCGWVTYFVVNSLGIPPVPESSWVVSADEEHLMFDEPDEM